MKLFVSSALALALALQVSARPSVSTPAATKETRPPVSAASGFSSGGSGGAQLFVPASARRCTGPNSPGCPGRVDIRARNWIELDATSPDGRVYVRGDNDTYLLVVDSAFSLWQSRDTQSGVYGVPEGTVLVYDGNGRDVFVSAEPEGLFLDGDRKVEITATERIRLGVAGSDTFASLLPGSVNLFQSRDDLTGFYAVDLGTVVVFDGNGVDHYVSVDPAGVYVKGATVELEGNLKFHNAPAGISVTNGVGCGADQKGVLGLKSDGTVGVCNGAGQWL